ncbi:DNA helicase [Jeotgalibacillus campisalis]|uniref:DNA helicase n=1 Tax=Jeotgalibacillus campisalis TaxID=220754 RepID=A0A0C2RLH9_9BACL|nr:DNA helicase [Jeotgalibacillus campisalis]
MLDELVYSIDRAKEIYILTAFTMRTGIEKLLPELIQASERGADIKILTGDYLCITQPAALRKILTELPEIEIRLWLSKGRSFHPKAYLFGLEQEDHVIVGSSNLSASALTHGVEWNLSSRSEDGNLFDESVMQFMSLFYNDQTVPLNMETVDLYEKRYERFHENSNTARDWTEIEEVEVMYGDSENKDLIVIEPQETYKLPTPSPRPAQEMALSKLEETKVLGYEKALVVMATGLGKTYLAAFFAKSFSRVLFIAHRIEILEQAKKSFNHVMPDRSLGILNGSLKEKETECVFASVSTLSLKKHLESFDPDHFDLIVVDEFHHAAAKSYLKIIEHFNPSFMLGITATPDRHDGKDVFALCDGNEAFRLNFWEAIQQKWLAPFHYYGIYDETDYSQIRWLGNQYDEEQLLQLQLREEMAEKIFHAWEKHKQTRTIGFCSSIRQAEYLGSYFKQMGMRVAVLHSRSVVSRGSAIEQLHNEELDIIFTVDLFNEGVDIPPVDTLLFVRPTESLTVFTQQLGRGLRLFDNKEHCTVIDLIGNYRNADIKLKVLDRDPEKYGEKTKKVEPFIPDLCELNLDTRLIDLFKEMRKQRLNAKERLLHELSELTLELGRRPSYLEFHRLSGGDSSNVKREFGSYPAFLIESNSLSQNENVVADNYRLWLEEVEKTIMTKSYKMVLLLAMMERGESEWFKPITATDAAFFFHDYVTAKRYRLVDFSDKQGKDLIEYNQKKIANLIKNMPMDKWAGSSIGIAMKDGDTFWFELGEVKEEHKRSLYEFTKEICEYRVENYFERKSESR